jgi:AsmA-like C-terminal region
MAAPRLRIRKKRWRVVAWIAAGLVVLCFAGAVVISKWAFGHDRIAKALSDATSGTVQFKSFRNVYVPRLGCVAEGVIIRRKDSGDSPPLISIAKLTIVSSLATVLRKHVSLMKAEGLQVTPEGNGWPESKSQSKIVIDELVADNASLQVLHDAGNKPLDFKVHHFSMRNVGGDDAMPFRVELLNPLPTGEISATGKLGPWKTQGRDQIGVTGSYSFRHADLSAIGGIAGLLSSDGKFEGTIRKLHVTGQTHTPEFEVTSTKHRFPLDTDFDAEVNATNGDVVLRQIDAKLLDTRIRGEGTVMPDPQQHRRTATLSFVAQDGKIQDVLFPFVKAPHSPMSGITTFRARVVLPGGEEPFVRRVSLRAEFGIADGRLTSAKSQQKLNNASERARGNPDVDHPEHVLSDLKGQVQLQDGVATFSNFSFAIPGALAAMHGTYNLVSERINFRGTLKLEAKISDTTGGIKGVLLKAISPFIKKNKPQDPLPVAVTGTYDHPQYSVSVTKDSQRRHGM